MVKQSGAGRAPPPRVPMSASLEGAGAQTEPWRVCDPALSCVRLAPPAHEISGQRWRRSQARHRDKAAFLPGSRARRGGGGRGSSQQVLNGPSEATEQQGTFAWRARRPVCLHRRTSAHSAVSHRHRSRQLRDHWALWDNMPPASCAHSTEPWGIQTC